MPDFLQPSLTRELSQTYPGAFTAVDLKVILMLPNGQPRGLANLAALSISTHRDKFPVTALSRINARGFTQGHRTVAGSLIFHTIDRGALLNALAPRENRVNRYGMTAAGPGAPDQLPLFDIHMTYVNEVGMLSFEAVYGVTLLDFGKTVSLQNLEPLESYAYMALDYQPLESIYRPEPEGFTLREFDRERQQLRVGAGPFNETWDPSLTEV